MRFPAMSAAVLALCALALPADAAGLNTTSAAHRAFYNLTLASSRGGDVVAATGTMGYEVIDACDGWAVRQRLSMTLTNSEGQAVQMVSDYATWESKDGLKFRFHMKQTTDTAVTSQTDGDAKLERTGGPGTAHYTVPEDTTKPLPVGTLFPMAHTSAIIAAAQAGKKFVALPLFDGTDDSGAEDSSVVVLDWKQPAPNKYSVLAGLPSTRVRLAFFDHASSGETPTYQVGMRYWENGVADNLQMDFGDFVMSATMTDFKPMPHKC
jgi:EipB-like